MPPETENFDQLPIGSAHRAWGTVTSCTCTGRSLKRAVWLSQRPPPLSLHPTTTTIMSLLQDVLRTQTLDSLDKTLANGRVSPDDDEELVGVVSYNVFFPLTLGRGEMC